MKIIQSFWTKPLIGCNKGSNSGRYKGGWLEEKYNLLSWTFSCLQLRRYYDEVELVTDEMGKNLLIDQLNLPYTKVHVELDCLNDYHSDLWALGKIYAYGMQEKPFIHIDGDVYIWNRFRKELEEADLIAQNIETGFTFYENLFKKIIKGGFELPQCMVEDQKKRGSITACNAGILGGNNSIFFKEFSKQAFSFVDNNLDKLWNIDIGRFNTIFEQYLFFCIAQSMDLPIKFYTELIDENQLGNLLKAFDKFKGAPYTSDFIHLYGEDCKKNPIFCYELERKVKEKYPAYFENLVDFQLSGSM